MGQPNNFTVPNYLPPAVVDLNSMFMNAVAFNQDISSWNTANVIYMPNMFRGAAAFNQNIGSWTTSKLSSMNSMFKGATAFNQNLSGWVLAVGPWIGDAQSIFANSPMATQPITKWPPFTQTKGGADPSINPTYYTT
jgi:surface protein